MLGPNLFDCGTTELTQDAVFCWLLRWADSRLSETDPQLHRLARETLSVLFEAAGRSLPSGPLTVRARTQVDKLDVVAWVGERFLLGIENKTDTGPHGGQLVRYKHTLEAMAVSEGRAVLPIYVKTGEISRGAQVRSQGWHPVGRAQLLPLLRRAVETPAPNDIVVQYLQWLEERESASSAWKTEPDLKRWEGRGWQGFYSSLEQEMDWAPLLGWSYVANAAGGFQALWWGFYEAGDAEVYLQLQQSVLAVRVKVVDRGRRRAERDQWCAKILDCSKTSGWPLQRPGRLGFGQHMAVAVWPDWLARREDGLVDAATTVERLRSLDAWVRELVAGEILG